MFYPHSFLMQPCKYSSWVFRFFIILLVFFLISSPSLSWSLHPLHINSTAMHRNHTAISNFRLINRRTLTECSGTSPFLQVNVNWNSSLSDEEYLTVTISGVLFPSHRDWVAMISASHSNVENCPFHAVLYAQTGDLSELPLLCHYPVKAMYMSNDPGYLSCKKKQCKKYSKGKCIVPTCSGTLTFRVIINIRINIEFVYFGGGFETPCVFSRLGPISFANPNQPLYGHISSVDSTGKSMRLTWVSGNMDLKPHVLFSAPDILKSHQGSALPSPAKDFGWHDPGYIHSVVMTGLEPSSTFSYRYRWFYQLSL